MVIRKHYLSAEGEFNMVIKNTSGALMQRHYFNMQGRELRNGDWTPVNGCANLLSALQSVTFLRDAGLCGASTSNDLLAGGVKLAKLPIHESTRTVVYGKSSAKNATGLFEVITRGGFDDTNKGAIASIVDVFLNRQEVALVKGLSGASALAGTTFYPLYPNADNDFLNPVLLALSAAPTTAVATTQTIASGAHSIAITSVAGFDLVVTTGGAGASAITGADFTGGKLEFTANNETEANVEATITLKYSASHSGSLVFTFTVEPAEAGGAAVKVAAATVKAVAAPVVEADPVADLLGEMPEKVPVAEVKDDELPAVKSFAGASLEDMTGGLTGEEVKAPAPAKSSKKNK